jgi:hypothetical protein
VKIHQYERTTALAASFHLPGPGWIPGRGYGVTIVVLYGLDLVDWSTLFVTLAVAGPAQAKAGG